MMSALKRIVVLVCLLAVSMSIAACSKSAGNPASPSGVTPVTVTPQPMAFTASSPDGVFTVTMKRAAPGPGGTAPIGAEVFIEADYANRGSETIHIGFSIVDVAGENPLSKGRSSTIFQAGTTIGAGMTQPSYRGWKVTVPERIPFLRITGIPESKIGRTLGPDWSIDVPLNWRLGE